MRKIIIFSLCFLFLASAPGIAAYAQQQQSMSPQKIEVDSDFNGKVDRIEHYSKAGEIEKVEIDADGNGRFEQWVIYKNGKPVKSERDTNEDGKPDVWIDY